MKGIPIIRLKQLKRTAVLLGAGALVAGASVLGATQAHASLGAQPGDLSFSPSSGAVTTSGITYSTTTACPAGNNGSGIVRLIDPGNPNTESDSTNLSAVNNSVTVPFSGTFNTTFSVIEQIFADTVGATSEVAVYCFSGPSATGTAVVEQSTFVSISADGSTYTETSSGPATPTTTTLTASPTSASAGQSVNLTATVSPASATGTVQFEVGGTDIGSPVTVSGGSASTATSFAAAGTEALSAVYTPTGNFTGSTGTLSYTVTAAAPNSGVIPLAVSVPATGTFTLTVDTTDTVTLAVTSAGTSATAATTPVVVSDTRNTFPGWSVSGQANEFVGSGTAAGATISGNQLGWTPTSSTSPLTQGVTLGGTVAPASPGLGSNPAVLASVTAGLNNGYGTTTLGANLDLLFPVPQAAGPYAGGLSITSVSTNP
jgi:Bacterial Ig-like domain (group 3)